MKDIKGFWVTLLIPPDEVYPSGEIPTDEVAFEGLDMSPVKWRLSSSNLQKALTLRFVMINNSGSCFAHGGSFTWWIFSPVFCCTPKSIPEAFSRNLQIPLAQKRIHREAWRSHATHSAQVKNSGISSRTSPRTSQAAESYALDISLEGRN